MWRDHTVVAVGRQDPGTLRQSGRSPKGDTVTDDRYELFISYSRKDDTGGWVTGLRDVILADHRRFSSEPMRILLRS